MAEINAAKCVSTRVIKTRLKLVTTLASDSPYRGQAEIDVLLTIQRPQGLFYMICIAPEADFPNLQSTFDEMMRSIRFSN